MSVTGQISVIGCGNMGTALLRGLLRECSPSALCGCDAEEPRRAELKALGCRVTISPTEAAREADVVVLAVKPGQIPEVVAEMLPALAPQTVVISLAAGVSLAALRSWGVSCPVARVMPNLPALVGEGATAVFAPSAELAARVAAIFSTVGRVVHVEREELLDVATALAGSGPGFLAVVLEGLIAGGVREGLSEKSARVLAAQTMAGTARMVLEQQEDPAALRQRVVTPGGTTEAGLRVLNNASLGEVFQDTIAAATNRAREIREKMR